MFYPIVRYLKCAGKYSQRALLFCALVGCLCAQGCASFHYLKVKEVPFKERIKEKTDGKVKVAISVLTKKEGEQVYGVNLSHQGVQAVWVEITNDEEYPYWLLRPGLDPDYYAPDEVAYASHRFLSGSYNRKVDKRFRELDFDNPIPAGGVHSGFILVHLDEGAREVDIDLIGHHNVTKNFTFFVPVPGIHATDVYQAESKFSGQRIEAEEEEELRQMLEELPCCTTSKNGKVSGDPVNIVVIGAPDDMFPAFVRRGWHMVEDTYWGSIKRTINSFLFGRRYLYSPVSNLYLFGRKQDFALQKSRGTVHRRNHLRLWLTPYLFKGKEVWVGQISRDIGVRFTTHTHSFVTHKIDADVDEARNGLQEDMLFSNGLKKVGFVKGVGPAPETQPRKNMTGDPYFTDGLRVVMLFERRPVSVHDMEFFQWELPSERTFVECE